MESTGSRRAEWVSLIGGIGHIQGFIPRRPALKMGVDAPQCVLSTGHYAQSVRLQWCTPSQLEWKAFCGMV